ncbi:hypothetical protein [Streptosporangium sp. NPDC006930]|uniref:hypothetical protein n=1 Tax=Streptosporangium sp. NPDC006930 TaxID=3154783 RepID=UPI003443CAD0
MRILDYFRTTKKLRLHVTMITDELEEVRDECAELADERDRLAADLAQAVRERDGVWRALAVEETRPLAAVPADAKERAELRRERERADALAQRLQTLQIANMRRDLPV